MPQSGLQRLANERGFLVSEVAPDARRNWEETLAANDVALALSDLKIGEIAGLLPRSTLCVIHNAQQRLVGGFALQYWPTRMLPGHRIVRLEQLGESIPAGAEVATASAILAMAARTRRILRVDVEVHDRDQERRSRIATALKSAGFDRQHKVRTYEKTLAIDLHLTDTELLSTFSSAARRQIRRAERFPIDVFKIESDTLIPKLEKIHGESFQRTGSSAPELPWPQLLEAARKAPERICIFGASLSAEDLPQELVAFAVVLRHGTYAVYDTAGSTRLPNRRIPLMYPVIWKLLRHARDSGATWFDFGGVTGGTSQSSIDPTGGISEFKRKFGGEELTVGENWRYEAKTIRGRLLSTVRRAISVLLPAGS